MRSNGNAPRSSIRQTLYPVIHVRRRRYSTGRTASRVRTAQPQSVPTPVDLRK